MRLRVGRRIVAMHEELHLRATRDWLTGAWNRGAIVGALKREMERASRTRQHVSVVLADVDHFKRINDRHGHLAGDDVLREVVRRIRAVLRPYDTIGRYGGEEFLVVLPNCDGPTAVEIAERMRAATSGLPFAPASVALKVTASFGVAELRADDTIESLVLRADQRLYRAKRSGRNSVIGGSRYAPIFSQRRPPV
jgi:diguanylate cyclase (GGDEF)-like protein